MAIRTIGTTITDSQDTLGLSPVQVQKFLAVTDKFGTTINGGLVQTVLTLLREANSTTETAGISGLQGPLKDLPAFWGGGTYAQALAGTSKSLIRHDGFAKFEYGKIAGFDIEGEKLTTTGAGISGVEGVDRKNPAFWAGGTYAEAVAGESKAIIRHDGTSKFTDTEIEGKVKVVQANGGEVVLDSQGLSVFNALGNMNIRFGLKNGYAVMEYYDNDGLLLYDLGPNGITEIEVRTAGFYAAQLIPLGGSFNMALTPLQGTTAKYKDPKVSDLVTYWRYTSKIVAGVNQDTENDGKYFTSASLSAPKMPVGVYCTVESPILYHVINGTNARVYLPAMHTNNEAVYDRNYIYYKRLDYYNQDDSTQYIYAYWNNNSPISPI